MFGGRDGQRGFVMLTLLPMMLVIFFSAFAVILASAFAARKNAVMTHQWASEAVSFAADAANRERDVGDAASRTDLARQWFVYAFAAMIEADFDGSSFVPRGESIWPGPIRLTGFRYAPPGTPVPGSGGHAATARPGYEADLEVPVLGARLPFIGEQYVTVPMRCLGVVSPVADR